MKIKFFTSLFTGTLILYAMTQETNAQNILCPDCWYISGYAGPAWHREMDTEFSIPSDTRTISSESTFYNLFSQYRTGYGVGGSIGAVFCRKWRLEIEGYFRNFNGKGVAVAQDTDFAVESAPDRSECCGDGCLVKAMFNPSTHYRSFSLMVNGFYDFCLCNSVSWYVGGGIGPSWVEYKVMPAGRPSNAEDHVFDFNAKTNEVRFSYQILTGIAYRFCDHISATIGYRLWGTTKDTDGKGAFHTTSLLITNATLPTQKVSEKRIPLVNSLEFGLRYAF